MNILIIGNGFDIAHKLPTSYIDYLNVCTIVKKARKYWVNGTSGGDDNLSKKERKIYSDFCAKLDSSLWNEFNDNINNFWVKWFKQTKETSGEKWVDFEEEIRKFINTIYEACNGDLNKKIQPLDLKDQKLVNCFRLYNFFYQRSYKKLILYLIEEKNKLTRSMDIYMDGYVNKIDVKRLSYIASKKIDKVLSFNYTVTYTEHYDAKVDCCYIHGKADIRKKAEECNMVLGFDDHYVAGTTAIPELIPFEKYYQRIVNRNDNQYFDWIDEINNSPNGNTIYIFGHSLGSTDGDVLRAFILNKNVRVKIFYYNEIDRAEKIKNLAIILGPDNLIKLTGGRNHIIQFETE